MVNSSFCRQRFTLALLLSSLLYTIAITTVCAESNVEASDELQADKLLVFSNDSYEPRYYRLIDELRCPKCQNQNLADSNAPIAKDLKSELVRLLEEGKGDAEILDFMTLRYGSFVRYQPPLNATTIILWALPVVVVVCGIFIWLGFLRRSSQNSDSGQNLAAGETPKQKQAPDSGERQRAIEALSKRLGESDD